VFGVEIWHFFTVCGLKKRVDVKPSKLAYMAEKIKRANFSDNGSL
jgi:hypothetical protein